MSQKIPIPGTSPKKLWVKKTLNSPTYKSDSMAYTLNMPEIYMYQHKHRKKPQYDSLDIAQRQFSNVRTDSVKAPSQIIEKPKSRDLQTSLLNKGIAQKHIHSTPKMTVQQQALLNNSKKLNYFDHKSIKGKQLLGYNILNGY